MRHSAPVPGFDFENKGVPEEVNVDGSSVIGFIYP